MAIQWDTAKDPDDVLDYQLNWAERVASLIGGDTINGSTWSIITAATTPPLAIDTDSFTNTTTRVWFSGGKAGTTYSLRNIVTTLGGRTIDQTVRVKVKER